MQAGWLKNIRDRCFEKKCVKHVYVAQINVLGKIAFQSANLGQYTCTYRNELRDSTILFDFSNQNGVISSVNAITAVKSSDLASGYSRTCIHTRNDFIQIPGNKNNIAVLQFYSKDNSYGEALGCEVRIADHGASIHVASNGCNSSCLRLNFRIKKNSANCQLVRSQ